MDSSGKRVSDIILGVLAVLIFAGTIGGLTYFEIKQRKEREDIYKATEEILKRLREEQEKERTDYRKGVNFIGKCYTLKGKDDGFLKILEATKLSFIARAYGAYAIGKSSIPVRVYSRSAIESEMYEIDCPSARIISKIKKHMSDWAEEEMKRRSEGGYESRKGI